MVKKARKGSGFSVRKNWMLLVLVVLLLIAGGMFGYNYYNNKAGADVNPVTNKTGSELPPESSAPITNKIGSELPPR